jgi:hypothetical protein
MSLVDPLTVIRARLLTQEPVTAIAGTRIYAVSLPTGFNPAPGGEMPDGEPTGPGLLIISRGGTQDYSSHVWKLSIQIKAIACDSVVATQLDFAVHTALNDTKWGPVMMIRREQLPQTYTEPKELWDVSLSFYKTHVRQA